jgi:hypothetical protein
MMRLAVGLILAFLLTPVSGFAQGGPPMVTDDPATVPDGHWEINLAGIRHQSRLQTMVSFPYADANYGWGNRTQLKFEGGLVEESEPDQKDVRGLSTALVGVKFRVLDEDRAGVAVSTYPQYEYHGWGTSRDERIASAGDHLFLPVEFSKSWGSFAVNPEIGYMRATRESDEWWYGLAFAQQFGRGTEALLEVHGRSKLASLDRELFFNVGMRMEMASWISLIGSAGHTWRTYREDEATTLVYLGAQLHL